MIDVIIMMICVYQLAGTDGEAGRCGAAGSGSGAGERRTRCSAYGQRGRVPRHSSVSRSAPCTPRATMTVKQYTREEISKWDTKKENVFIIDNVVYNVTEFLDEHPGGHEVLVNLAGKDASEDFDDVGHSLDAKDLMKKYVVGELVEADRVQLQKRTVAWEDSKVEGDTGFTSSWKFPVLLGIVVTVLYSYLFG